MQKISLVIPFYNEEENVVPVLEEVFDVLEELSNERGYSYEVICIDDGSTDRTYELLKECKKSHPEMIVIHFGINYGQTAALSAGFHYATGQIVITMDGDGQNDPHDIPQLIDALEEQNVDVVSGWRKERKDPWLRRRLPSQIANWLISRITGVHLRDYGCTLKAYRCEIVKDLHLYGEMHRFIPALARWLGGKVGEIPVHHRPRLRGSSKYGLSRVTRVLLDLFVVKFLMNYSTRPIHFFGQFGLAVALIGILVLLFVFIYRFIDGLTMNRNPLLYVGLTVEMIACQIILMGLLGEILARTYHESQDKPIFRVKELLPAGGDTHHEERERT